MMGHNLDLAEAMFLAWDAGVQHRPYPAPLKEVIRVQLSRAGGVHLLRQCPVCFGEATGIDRGPPGRGHRSATRRATSYSAKEKLALRYSELMATDAGRASTTRSSPSCAGTIPTSELVELGSFIGFNIGYHTFFGTLKFYPMFSPDGRLVSQDESARLYGAAPASLGSKEAAE